MKDVIKRLGLVVAISVITFGLMAIPAKKQQQRVNLQLTVQEVDLVLKALSELPLKESGNLYIGIQQQANAQLQPPPTKPKADTSAGKTKKP